ncbi:nuclear transport factor 2 family protein [Gordonia zhaorongruii]|uniref:nuclear transport factor 2 family protein n=1 Tax=Gordonia zhaorongruii TaxID=2597659 RepID=UPI001047C85F|nr:nuclear transport factor 2 family protein [Gordonia zhaorongruii]
MTDTVLADLLARVRRLEDERDIARLIASYGPLVDAGEAHAASMLWADDGVYDVEGWLMTSRDDVRAMVESRPHRGLIGRGCVHFHSPAVIHVDGDEATAVCETLLVVRRNGPAGDTGQAEYSVQRAGATDFTLRRDADSAHGWVISRRTTRLLDGSPEAAALLSRAVTD